MSAAAVDPHGMDITSLPRLLTLREVADLLRTTPKATYAMVSRGQLPGVVRIGRRVLIRYDDLVEWLHERRAPSPEGDRR